jgi:hypothetical protein
MSTGYQTILSDVEERLAVVTFNRPEKRNAIDQTMVNELHDLLDGFVADGHVQGCVFVGAGDKAFVGGADIAQLRERNASDALQAINASLFSKIESLPFPTIAAVRGFCLAARAVRDIPGAAGRRARCTPASGVSAPRGGDVAIQSVPHSPARRPARAWQIRRGWLHHPA